MFEFILSILVIISCISDIAYWIKCRKDIREIEKNVQEVIRNINIGDE